MKIDVKVYTTPVCQQCNMTKKLLDKNEIEYEVIDLTEHPEKLEEFKAQGFAAAPIVTAGDKIWSGFRHDKITDLVHLAKSAER